MSWCMSTRMGMDQGMGSLVFQTSCTHHASTGHMRDLMDQGMGSLVFQTFVFVLVFVWV